MLPVEVMRQIRRLQLRARRAVRTLFGGEYRSAFKGAGLSFEEVREYQPGDDVRSIDWNVTARMGTAFVKRYAEERELTVVLMVDFSASRLFGTGATTKRAVSAELATVLAFAAVTHNDRVTLLGFTDAIERHVRPGKGTRHALRVLREVLYFEPRSTRTDLTGCLDSLNALHRRRAIVFLVSDFLDTGYDDAFKRTARRHDLIAVRTSDARELDWLAAGLLRLEDAETGEQAAIDTDNDAFRTQFAAQSAERRAAFDRLARAARVDVIDATTDGKHFDALLQFFRTRERRRRVSR
jgi:uncharacterized protein (DUF58 family)